MKEKEVGTASFLFFFWRCAIIACNTIEMSGEKDGYE